MINQLKNKHPELYMKLRKNPQMQFFLSFYINCVFSSANVLLTVISNFLTTSKCREEERILKINTISIYDEKYSL